MSRPFRICLVFVGVVAIVLGLAQIALAGSQTKRTKKRQKKVAITVVVLPGTIRPQTSISQPLTSNVVTASNGDNSQVGARASHPGISVMKMPNLRLPVPFPLQLPQGS